MTDHRQRATDLLVNYFKAVAERAGMKWDADYAAEIGEAVDEIIEATVERLQPKLERVEEKIDVPDWRNRR